MKLSWSALKDEKGSVESAMVLVPLLLLFLIGAQLATAVHTRNMERQTVQDQVTKRAISGVFSPDDEFLHIDSSGDGQNLDLLISRRSTSLTNLIPNFLGGVTEGRGIDLYGLAIVENQR
jgi:hypothetical protein